MPDLDMSQKMLDQPVALCRQELLLCPLGSPSHSHCLSTLANALHDRFKQLGEFEDLEEAITCHREALVLRPPGHPDRSASLYDLAVVVWARFKRKGQNEDLDEAIAYHRQALDLRPPGHPKRATSLTNLAATLGTRFDKQGQVKDLEEVITCHRQVLDLRPPGHPDRSESLYGLAGVVWIRFKRKGENEDLDEAIACHRQALDLRPPSHPNRAAYLTKLVTTVRTRFDQQGQIKDLEEAITCYHEAVDLCPPGHPDRAAALSNFANTVRTRFYHRGQMADLENAIMCHRQALDLHPPGHPNHSTSLDDLASTMWTRFNQQGLIEALEEAITYHRQALNLRPPGHPGRPISLHNFAIAVHTRFNHQGLIEDLEEAIICHRQVLDLHIPGHIERSTILNNLAAAVVTRFNQRGQIADLEEAITCHRQALDLRPPCHPERFMSFSNLAYVVWTRFTRWGQLEDLEEAIACARQAVALRPLGHPNSCEPLRNLASAVSTRFRRLCGTDDLEEAIKHLCEAEDTLPISHPLHTELRSDLATNYLLRHESHFQLDDCFSLAFRLFERAANHSTAPSKDRFNAALLWAREARHYKHLSTVQAYTVSLTLLDRRLNVTPDVESQQYLLATTSSIPRSLALDAASSAIDAGMLETAIELLEQGRAILWTKLRGFRHPLHRLRDIDRELADRFETSSSRLECLAMSSDFKTIPGSDEPSPTTSISSDAKIRQHRILLEEWNNLVSRIRQIEGFTNFLQAVPFATLQLAAAEGPVIVVNISEYRSDAIILRGVGLPVLVPLPNTSPRGLALLSSQLSAARFNQTPQKIPPILRSLWNTIVQPVVSKLATLGVAKKSRIWWCPTSELCALPLHAAGSYNRTEKNLPDLYISSYTPTLSNLIKARSGIMPTPTVPSFLVMGQPGDCLTVGALPSVTEEIRRISSFGDFSHVLVAREANRQAVLSGLEQHNWIHFACHGHLVEQPFHSYFQLYNNERLTLLDLIKARLPSAEFAFLSVCHSAAGDIRGTPDEVIHLAAGVQFSGFRSVVGTLWGMADIDGPHIAQEFYGHMFRKGGVADFRDSATALNLATRAMRQREGMTIDRWINFVHIGA